MNKQKILNEINKIKEHLDNLVKKLEGCNERWKPKDFSPYFYVDSCMKIEESDFYNDTYIHSERYNTYSTFKTKEEAETEAEKILVRRQLEDIAKRLNKGEEIDWFDSEQPKYCIELYCNDIMTNFYFSHKTQGTTYCLDENFLGVAKREIGEERLKAYLRGE